jgi:hypothetical protein
MMTAREERDEEESVEEERDEELESGLEPEVDQFATNFRLTPPRST